MRSADAQAKLASVDRARAALDAAQLNLSYCNIVAPVDGVATHKSVEPGQIVQAGQGLLVVVPLQNVWVTANFKETQLRNMKPGQKAYVKSDTYGKTFDGHVDSIAGATGAVLSLLPPENATGNYVKVVQRIPVKIVLDPISPDVAILRPGMNVEATVVTSNGVHSTELMLQRFKSKLRMPDGSINPWVVAITVTLATFMEVLDTSIANVALPHIAGSLSASADESTWVLTSYLVSNAIILPLSGWLSSVIGRKRFYMICVAIFTMSSFLCGFAASLGMLVVFRILQGVGGGGLQPSEQAILNDTFPISKRGMAFAVYGIAVVVAPTIGPWLGGWITDSYSWRWIFYINVPVGIISLTLTYFLVSDPPYMKRVNLNEGFRVDYIGLGLISLGLGSMQIILDKGQREDWFSSNFIRFFVVTMLIGVIAGIIWELRAKDPVVDFRMLKNRNFAIATTAMFFLGFVLYSSTVLIPQLLQELLATPRSSRASLSRREVRSSCS